MLTQRDMSSFREVRIRRSIDDWAIWASALFVAVVLAGIAVLSLHIGFPVAAAFYLLGAIGILVHPRLGLYLVTFFAIVGETNTMPWYPFNKNGSSAESILYIHDKLVASPYEGYIAITAVGLLWQLARSRQPLTMRSDFSYPAATLSAAAVMGVVWGYANGSVLSIAINQSRNLILIPVLYLLVVNLVTDRRHIRILVWLIVIAVAVEACFILESFYGEMTSADRNAIRDAGLSPSTHSSSLHANISIFVLIASALIGRTYRGLKYVLPFLLVPTLIAYYLSERRSAIGALLIALALLALVLAKQRLQRFLLVVPLVSVVLAGYTMAFWNSEGGVAFPAQAIRSQISPQENTADGSSDLYRVVENINLESTIASNPLLGTGFGRPFNVVIPLPDLTSDFPLWNYLPHNSVLYVWVNAGLLGIIAVMYLWFRTVREGTALAIAAQDPDDILIATLSAATVVMIAVFTYLDISWDNQTVLLMVLSMGWISALRRMREAEQGADANEPAGGSADARGERRDVSV